MAVLRQDAWTANDDLMLAEVTLRHIQEGSTQLAAFEEVGERIGRTAAACGFRWNSTVRKQYEASIQIAKAQRKKRNQLRKNLYPVSMPENNINMITLNEPAPVMKQESISLEETSLSMDTVLRYLRHWKNHYQDMSRQYKTYERDLREKDDKIQDLRRENERLRKEMSEVQTDYRVVNDDYKALIQIMDRARKLAFLVEEEEQAKPRFKMDENGNLERIE